MMDANCIMLRILIIDIEFDLGCEWLIMISGDQIMLLMLVEDLWYDYVLYNFVPLFQNINIWLSYFKKFIILIFVF